MCEIRDVIETKRSRAAFNRMCATKNSVDLFYVGVFQIETEQALLHLHQKLKAFGDIGLLELVETVHLCYRRVRWAYFFDHFH